MKEDYQKALKKLTLFFLLNPVPFNGQSFQKQKRPGTSDQSLFRSQNKFRKIPLLDVYYLTKFDDIIRVLCSQVWWYNQGFVQPNFATTIFNIRLSLSTNHGWMQIKFLKNSNLHHSYLAAFCFFLLNANCPVLFT